jgi:hypothetical protein
MRFRPKILVAIAVFALAALTMGSGIAFADDDDSGASQVRSSGRLSVPLGDTSAARALPLTRVRVSARCQHSVPPPELGLPSSALARAFVEAAAGKTLDGFSPNAGIVAGQSLLSAPAAARQLGGTFGSPFGTTTVIASSNQSTATITMGAGIDDSGNCTFLWQAVESRNS